jgi:hypothetical protein
VVGALAALLACGACGSFGSASSDGPVDAAQSDGASLDGLVADGSLAEVGPPEEAGDAGADAPFVSAGPCGLKLDCERVVFVTSTTVAGNAVGGTAGADQRCTELALKATDAAAKAILQGRTFKAWLSTSTSAAKDRLQHGTKAYRLVDGTVIANDWNDLVDGTIAAPIGRTESGGLVPASLVSVWTGTFIGAEYSALACSDWAPDGGQGTVGSASEATAHWTNRAGGPCAEPARLYCFEQ